MFICECRLVMGPYMKVLVMDTEWRVNERVCFCGKMCEVMNFIVMMMSFWRNVNLCLLNKLLDFWKACCSECSIKGDTFKF